ncbi:MAG: M14 family metallopeptidase [Planctomycetota bacterium]|nr:M14 family metallopeptidase [Planctomycetota bacterium]
MHTLLAIVLLSLPAAAAEDDLLTVAEASDYRATATHAQVMDLLQRIDRVDDDRDGIMHLTEFGRSFEGRTLPLAIFADPPITTPGQARQSGKPVVYAWADIHAGEVCGKEAFLMLARELVTTPDHPLLDDLVILLAPIYNPDGNDRMSTDNRPNQVGPEEGMGRRANAQNLDLNRDWVKLDSPEAKAMVKVFTAWDPHIVIDSHTTNGSHHRNALTYAGLLNPSCHRPSLLFMRDELLPAVTQRLRDRTGYETFFYGNFNREQTVWATYSAGARYSGPYCGLRGHMSILSEAHAYIPYKDRIIATREFVREVMRYAAEHRERVMERHAAARKETIAAGLNPQPDDCVGIRHTRIAFNEPRTVKGWVMKEVEGRRRPQPTDIEKDYEVIHIGRFMATLSVHRPYAYILPPEIDNVIDKLREHGIEVRPFEGQARVGAYTVTNIERSEREYQKHHAVMLEVEAHDAIETFPRGSMMVPTAQPLGTLAVYLLEPRSEDGLVRWNFFDEHIAAGEVFPAYRVRSPLDLTAR